MDKIHEEIRNEVLAEEPTEYKRSPIIYIVGLFLAILLIMWLLPLSSIRLDPEPSDIPTLDDILPNYAYDINNITRPTGDIRVFVQPASPVVKQVATKIATQSCDSSREAYRVCQAKAVFYFVQQNFQYVSEADDYIQLPEEMFYSRGGDCDDLAAMLASLELAIGNPVRFVFVPGHVYVQIYLEEAHDKYKQEDGWIDLDAACRNCAFGEATDRSESLPKQYLWLNVQ